MDIRNERSEFVKCETIYPKLSDKLKKLFADEQN